MKRTLLAFGWVIGLLIAGSPVKAQETDPVPIPIPSFTVTNTYAAKFICGVQPDASIKIMPDGSSPLIGSADSQGHGLDRDPGCTDYWRNYRFCTVQTQCF